MRSRHSLYLIAVTTTIAMLGAARPALPAVGQPWPTLAAGPYPVGYKTIEVVDRGRTVAPLESWDGSPRTGDNFRPVLASIWYPAAPEDERPPMLYRDYIEAAGFATRLDGRWVTGAEAWVGHSLFGGADEELLRRVLGASTTALRDATPRHGRYPAIVYAPSFSYEPFENAALFEYLASHGYVIAASRSSGPETREMSYDLHGVEASVRDLELLLGILHDFGHADLTSVGAGGFSWGGLSAAMLAMRHFNVRAVLALDGTLEHAELPSVRERYDWRPRQLRGGYLALVGDREPTDSLAGDALYADLVELRLPELQHWDFASDMIRIHLHAAATPDPERRHRVEHAFGVIAHQARLLFDAYLKGDEEARETFLSGDLPDAEPELQLLTLTARPALPAPPSSAEFTELLRRDPVRARATLEAAKRNEPDIRLLDWQKLQDAVSTSPFERKLEILELVREELGESSIYFNNLGQAWRQQGDRERALDSFRKALEHNPDSGFAKRSIDELESEGADPNRQSSRS